MKKDNSVSNATYASKKIVISSKQAQVQTQNITPPTIPKELKKK